MSEDYCIHECYYMDTPDECLLDLKTGLPRCRRAMEEAFRRLFWKDAR